jgi:hypothetical protein
VDLIWWVRAIAGCAALAGGVAAALWWPVVLEPRRLRPLANVARLTRLPAYVRAARRRALSMVVAVALLCVIFAAAVIAAARPTGLPSARHDARGVQPEDIMVCVGGPVTDPAAAAVLQYFADRVPSFSTQRIGLTSPNRRVVPLTRDYQYAAAQFGAHARAAGQRADAETYAANFSPRVSYADYAGGVEDVLAMCLTGFPSFDQKTPQRRSLIYVGPDALRTPGDARPALFIAQRVRDLAITAGVQVNVLVTGAPGDTAPALARDTGGRTYSADSGVAAHVAEIRAHPPAPAGVDDGAVAIMPTETPDIPLAAALLALAALSLWPVLVRR